MLVKTTSSDMIDRVSTFFVLLLTAVGTVCMEACSMQQVGQLFLFACSVVATVCSALTREHLVVGYSMCDTLWPGCRVRMFCIGQYSSRWYPFKDGDVIAFVPDKRAKRAAGIDQGTNISFLKRITQIDDRGMFFVEGDARRGDDCFSSIDSNDFGAIDRGTVIGIWI